MEEVSSMADKVKMSLAGDDTALVSQINRLRDDLDEVRDHLAFWKFCRNGPGSAP